MPTFEGWRDYDDFAHAVRFRHRFVQTEDIKRFLDVLAATSGRRVHTRTAGTRLWRAQTGCTWETRSTGESGGIRYFVSHREPYSTERMVPDPAWMKLGGRGNPPGIAYLYLGDSRETAIAEVRPWKAADLTLAAFIVERDLRLLDLTLFPPPKDDFLQSVSTSTPHPAVTEETVWSRINSAFATPVDPNDSQLDYIPTQYLAEFFRERRFDGLLYGSALAEGGKNYMLFRPADARVEDREVVTVTRVAYEHRTWPRRETPPAGTAWGSEG